MIDLKQLRIGNWIMPVDGDKKPVQLSLQIIVDCILGMDSLGNYDYFSISKEILNKFLFIQIGNDKYNYYLDKIKLGIFPHHTFSVYDGVNDIDSEPECKFFQMFVCSNYVKDIKYLHEVQNVIHTFTSIELNDVVAYNYYCERIIKYNSNSKPINFEGFIILLSSVIDKNNYIPNYNLGDLPPTLFS